MTPKPGDEAKCQKYVFIIFDLNNLTLSYNVFSVMYNQTSYLYKILKRTYRFLEGSQYRKGAKMGVKMPIFSRNITKHGVIS